MQPLIGIVIVNWNGENFLKDCLDSVRTQTYESLKCVIVDNNSTDASVDLIKNYYSDVSLILNNENLGVAEGNNQGINYWLNRGAKYIVLLNNDTKLDPNLISNLFETMGDDSSIAAGCPKIYYFDEPEIIFSAGGTFSKFKARGFERGQNEKDIGVYNEICDVTYSSTCCLMVRAEIFRAVGFMDTDYYMYADDTDFIYRLHKKNYRVIFVPKAIMWHRVQASTGGRHKQSLFSLYYGARNTLLFAKKHDLDTPFFLIYFYSIKFLRFFLWIFKGELKRAMVLARAIVDYYRGIYGRSFEKI